MLHRLRTRYLLAMGLPIVACGTKDQAAPVEAPTATASVTPTATATATATPTATATATPTATASATPPARPAVASFEQQYPFNNGRGCSSASAHCFLLADLKAASCPAVADVPRGCMDGGACIDPHALVSGALLTAVSKTASAAKHAPACCYQEPDNCCAVCGRALRDGDTLVATPSARRTDWRAPLEAQGDALFASMAAAEHASIASFARTTLALRALGAPPDLVADTQRAALDEIEHARTMYALAGTTLGPGPLAPFAQIAPTLESFAVATLRDACVGETLGVVVLRELAEARPDLAPILLPIADDEERHAELAFRMLAWAVSAGGASVRDALQSALAAIGDDRGVARTVIAPCVNELCAAA